MITRAAPLVVAVVVAAAIVLGVGLVAAGCGSAGPAAPPAVVATAKTGVDHASLLALAGSLVGGTDRLADPATGRLPDLQAFRAAGIGTLTVSDSTIRVVMLRSAGADQRLRVEQALRSSSLIAAVESR